MGMGVDLRGGDYTKAAVRALRDALWHNSLTVVPALGYSVDDMQVDIEIAVAEPAKATVNVVRGGLDVRDDDRHTVVANAAAVVYLDIETTGKGAS